MPRRTQDDDDRETIAAFQAALDEELDKIAAIGVGAMSSWNYRIVELHNHEFAVMEVYYDDAGEINGYVEDPAVPFGDTLADLHGDLKLMMGAFEKKVLTMADLEKP